VFASLGWLDAQETDIATKLTAWFWLLNKMKTELAALLDYFDYVYSAKQET
jgi:hypothetical protein